MKDEKKIYCAVCGSEVESEEPAILTVSGYGNPRYLCEECEESYNVLINSIDRDELNSAVEKIYEHINRRGVDDDAVLNTTSEIIETAKARMESVKLGTYDPNEKEEEEEIPEELLMTEEEIEEEEEENKKNEKLEKILNIITYTGFGIAAAVMLYFFIRMFI